MSDSIDKDPYFVLGVDAAWTAHKPSGVALLKCFEDTSKKPELLRGARSYEEFCSKDRIEWDQIVTSSAPDFIKLIKSCECELDLIALDIPLSPKEIVQRRAADEQISKAYGRYGASVHSPGQERPRYISRDIYNQLTRAGFHWAGNSDWRTPSFIEVYPHVAIIELFDYSYRAEYKVEKRRAYWPNDKPEERMEKLVCEINRLKMALSEKVNGVENILPVIDNNAKPKMLKGYEDLLDAIISGLVGVYFIRNQAMSFGDEIESAIWVPKTGS